MTGCNFFYQIISAGRRLAGPAVGHRSYIQCTEPGYGESPENVTLLMAVGRSATSTLRSRRVGIGPSSLYCHRGGLAHSRAPRDSQSGLRKILILLKKILKTIFLILIFFCLSQYLDENNWHVSIHLFHFISLYCIYIYSILLVRRPGDSQYREFQHGHI